LAVVVVFRRITEHEFFNGHRFENGNGVPAAGESMALAGSWGAFAGSGATATPAAPSRVRPVPFRTNQSFAFSIDNGYINNQRSGRSGVGKIPAQHRVASF